MEANDQTVLYALYAKRTWFKSKNRRLKPGDRTAVRPERPNVPTDRWLIVRIPIGGNHMGDQSLRTRVLDWEQSMFPWLDAHQTAMWDGHELGCGEFRLLLLTPNPSDLRAEITPQLPAVPGITFEQRSGPDGEDRPF